MSNPSGPDAADESARPAPDADDGTEPVVEPDDVAAAGEQTVPSDPVAAATTVAPSEAVTAVMNAIPADATDVTETMTETTDGEPATEVIETESPVGPAAGVPDRGEPENRRFTAPGFDSTETEVMPTVGGTATEAPAAQPEGEKAALTPKRLTGKLTRSWTGVLALVLAILLLAAAAVLATLWFTRGSRALATKEEAVRTTIESFDVAVQDGDLAALRSLTCGTVRDGYVNYNDDAWKDTYQRIAAAKQYPVVASIDEVVVNGDYAEANVTAFMAYAPQIRSTRSLDLQYRDNGWKICQARGGQ